MNNVERYQQQLLDHAAQIYMDTPLSAATQQAFLAVPRHLFTRRYRLWGDPRWYEVRPDNLGRHLETIYRDAPLILFGDDDDAIPSTISQPSFVLRMLDMLQLQEGQRVLEIGTGSGWNAGLLGHLVGPRGNVYSLEIIPEAARLATEQLADAGVRNVEVILADGGAGYPQAAPYDRVIFTAGNADLPRELYAQIAEGGLLLAVFKHQYGHDLLVLLEKRGEHFVSQEMMFCGFVSLQGQHQRKAFDPISLEQLPDWETLRRQEIARNRFGWSAPSAQRFFWKTRHIRFFVSLQEPGLRIFNIRDNNGDERVAWGIWLAEERSLVLVDANMLISYGNHLARNRLLGLLHSWVDLGMPGVSHFQLAIYPQQIALAPGEGEWLTKGQESQFLWSLKA